MGLKPGRTWKRECNGNEELGTEGNVIEKDIPGHGQAYTASRITVGFCTPKR